MANGLKNWLENGWDLHSLQAGTAQFIGPKRAGKRGEIWLENGLHLPSLQAKPAQMGNCVQQEVTFSS
jgi:hypothetical protein